MGDTRGGNWGCHSSIFSWKTWRPFLVASSAVSPLISSSQKLTTFFLLIAFYCFHSGVTPSRVSPTPILSVRPRFSTILCKFVQNVFSFGCHPLDWRVSPGAVRPRLPLVTPLQLTVGNNINKRARLIQQHMRNKHHKNKDSREVKWLITYHAVSINRLCITLLSIQTALYAACNTGKQ